MQRIHGRSMRFKWNCNHIWLMKQLISFQNYENKPLQQKNGRSLYWKHCWALYIQSEQGQHILFISLEIRLFFIQSSENWTCSTHFYYENVYFYSASKKIGRKKHCTKIGWNVMLQLRLINQLNYVHIPNKHCRHFFCSTPFIKTGK